MRLGYCQLKVKPSSVLKVAFRTKYGHYEFLIVLFGQMNTLATFIYLKNQVFSDYLDKFIMIFISDISVFSKSCEWLE